MPLESLFVYGSLQPGGPNAHVLADIAGRWAPAVLRGRLVESGWGATLGYPGMVLDESGGDVAGHVLTSQDLTAHWARLDAFEGEQYQRVIATVTLAGGERVPASVYVLRQGATKQTHPGP